MATIRIPTPLRIFTGGQNDVLVGGRTVSEALAELAARHPAIRPHLFKENGDLRAFVNIYLGEDNINDLHGLQTPLRENDHLRIIPNIAGG